MARGGCGRWCAPAHATQRSSSAAEAGRFVAGQRGALGPVVGRIARGDGLVVAVPRGAGIDLAAVDRELGQLRRDGTLGRLARAWLGLDPASLPVLR